MLGAIGLPGAEQVRRQLGETILEPVADIAAKPFELLERGEELPGQLLSQLPGLTEALPRGIRESPLGQAATRGLREIAGSVPLQAGAGAAGLIPGVAGAFGQFLTRGLIEEAPEQLALMGMGNVVKAARVFPRLRDAIFASPRLRPIAEALERKLVFRGGFDPKAKVSFEEFDIAGLRGKEVGREVGESIAQAVKGARDPEQSLRALTIIAHQPREIVEDLAKVFATEVDLNIPGVAAQFASKLRKVPGFVQGSPPPEALAEAVVGLPKTKIRTFFETAADAADAFKVTKQGMISAGIKNPDFFARMNANGFFPLRYSFPSAGIFPKSSKLIRERKVQAGLIQRQDLPADVRQALQEFEVPAHVAASMVLASQNTLIATRRLFNALAANGSVRLPAKIARELTKGRPAAARAGHRIAHEGIMFERMPTSADLGPLSNKFVRVPEAAEINFMTQQPGNLTRFFRSLWTSWKFGKTVLNPKTQIANLISNAVMADMAGLSPWDFPTYLKALRAVTRRDAIWKELKENGAEWAFARGTAMQQILDEGTTLEMRDKGLPMYLGLTKKLHRWMVEGNPVSRAMSNSYQDAEALMKTALYIKLRNTGVAPRQAVLRADRALINYRKVPHWVKQVRSSPLGIPFVTFTYGVTPLTAEFIATRPHRLLQYFITIDAFNEMRRGELNIPKEDWEAVKKTMWDQGGLPMLMFRDERGVPVIYNVVRFTPFQEFQPEQARHYLTGGPVGFLENMILQNPLVQEVLVRQISGYDPVFQRQVFEPLVGKETFEQFATLTGGDPKRFEQALAPARATVIKQRALSAARTFLPELAGGGATQNIISALQERPSFLGDPLTIQRALAESIFGKGISETALRGGLTLQVQKGLRQAQRQTRREARREPR